MEDRIAAVAEPYVDSRGEFRWPSDSAARDRVASDFLGACTIASLDHWIAAATEVLHNPVASPAWRRSHVGWREQQPLRDQLARLSDEQRDAVGSLLLETAFGVVHSLLAHLDQFPQGILEMRVLDLEGQAPKASIYEGDPLDLHERLFGWVERFSEHAGRLLPPASE